VPTSLLRSWRGAGGERWLQVEAAAGADGSAGRRGWLLA